jgi:hypothetical protein
VSGAGATGVVSAATEVSGAGATGAVSAATVASATGSAATVAAGATSAGVAAGVVSAVTVAAGSIVGFTVGAVSAVTVAAGSTVGFTVGAVSAVTTPSTVGSGGIGVESADVNSPGVPGAAVSVVGPIALPVDVVPVDVVEPCWSDSSPVAPPDCWAVAWVPVEVVDPFLLVPVVLVDLVALAFCVASADWPGIEAPPRYGAGLRASPPTRASKCRWGPVQLPVQPT